MRLPAVPSDNQFRILVVEDDTMIAKLLIIHLEKAKFQVIHARDGLEGWSQFTRCDPHLVLSDINMPGLSGHDLVEKIRETSSVPILMMTAADSEDYQLKGFKVGADDYIPKPFNPKLLIARVVANLRRVYRYDAEITSAQTKAEAHSGVDWPKCENCGYIGPANRFQFLTATDQMVAQCPNCKARNVSFSIG